MLRDGGAARVTPLLVTILIVLLALVAVLLMPVAFRMMSGSTRQWERLSFMAEVFTAGAGALIVVTIVLTAAAFWFQAREYRAMRELGIRGHGRELVFKAMDDPALLAAWGGPADPSMRDDDPRLHLYLNELVNWRQMSYGSGGTNEAEVRIGAQELFSGRIGRAYWAVAGGDRATTAVDRTERRFHTILDEEYRAALGRPVPPDEPLPASSTGGTAQEPVRARPGSSAVAGAVAGGVAGAVAAIAAGYLFARRGAEPARRRRPRH